MAAGGSAGTLYVTVAAKTDPLAKGMAKGRKEVGAFTATTNKALGVVTKFGAAMAGAFSTAALIRGLKNTAQSIDEIGKSSDRLGASTEALIGLRHGAELSGVSTGQLTTALTRFNRTIGDARVGLISARRPFETLGIDLKRIADLPMEQQLGAVADALQTIENPADRTRVAMELFGRAGAGMLSVLQDGSVGLREFQADAEKLGITFSREEALKVEQFNDELDRLKKVLGGTLQGIVIEIAPSAIKYIQQLTDFVAFAKGDVDQLSAVDAWRSNIEMLPDDMFDKFAAEFRSAADEHGRAGVVKRRFGLSKITRGQVNAIDNLVRDRELVRSREQLEEGKRKAGAARTFITSKTSEQLGAAARMAENTAKNIAKLGKDGAAALGLGAKWNELQRAALLAPFKMTPKAKIGADEPGMVAKQHQAALTLARSGSVESYRQRAAIARQANPLLDIGKKQLKAGERTAVAVEQIAKNGVVLAPANLKGG